MNLSAARLHCARGLGMKTTLLLLAALLLAPLVWLAAAELTPNVLLILSDDHSYPHVGCTVSESRKLGHVTLQADQFSGPAHLGGSMCICMSTACRPM